MRHAADVRVEDELGRARARRLPATRCRARRRASASPTPSGSVAAKSGFVQSLVPDVSPGSAGARRVLAGRDRGRVGRREAVHVARDRELRVDAVLRLHVDVAQVQVVAPVASGAVVRRPLRRTPDRAAASFARPRTTCSRVGRVRGARRRAVRRVERRAHEEVALPAERPDVDLRVVLVGEDDDRDERVGAEEVVALLEDRRVDADPLRRCCARSASYRARGSRTDRAGRGSGTSSRAATRCRTRTRARPATRSWKSASSCGRS